MTKSRFLSITLTSILFASILITSSSAFPATIQVPYEYDEFFGGQANLRGLIIHMKTDALLTEIALTEGTNCNLVMVLDSMGNPLASSNVTDGKATINDLILHNGQEYTLAVGDTNSLCNMQGHSALVDYQTQYVDFIHAFNGNEIQDGPFLAVKGLTVELGSIRNVSLIPRTEGELIVEVNMIGEVVSFDMDDYVYLGDVSKGFESVPSKVDISNTGNTNIALSALKTGGDDFFSNMRLSRRLSGEESEFKYFDDFDLIVPRPEMLGGVRDDYFYAKLDLKNYDGQVPIGENRLGANFRFIAVAI